MLAGPHRREAKLTRDLDLLQVVAHGRHCRVTRGMLAGQEKSETYFLVQCINRRYLKRRLAAMRFAARTRAAAAANTARNA